jgi:hypothetical protein
MIQNTVTPVSALIIEKYTPRRRLTGRGGAASVLALMLVIAGSGPARGDVIYDESVSGDLSNSGLTPTLLTVSLGSNEVLGTTGKDAVTGIIDRDYFTFTVPDGLELAGITLLPGTQTLGKLGESFIGLEAGPEVTVATSATTAAGLLGWYHYGASDIGNDILPPMGSAGLGSTGFTPPLPAGTYSFWVQEASVGTVNYGLDFIIATPEPAYWPILLPALLGACILHRRRVRAIGSPRSLP